MIKYQFFYTTTDGMEHESQIAETTSSILPEDLLYKELEVINTCVYKKIMSSDYSAKVLVAKQIVSVRVEFFG